MCVGVVSICGQFAFSSTPSPCAVILHKSQASLISIQHLRIHVCTESSYEDFSTQKQQNQWK